MKERFVEKVGLDDETPIIPLPAGEEANGNAWT